jgi:solute carrier family 25 protein 16
MHGQAEKSQDKAVLRFLIGGISGAVAKSAVAPLERVKILYQVNNRAYGGSVGQTLKEISRREGMVGLFRGNSASFAKTFGYNAVRFSSWDLLKRHSDHAIPHFVLGAVAGGIAVVATYPLDLLRSRQAVTNQGLRQSLKGLHRNGGLGAGLGTTLVATLPFSGVNFVVFDLLNEKLKVPMLCGGISGLVASTVTFPLDVLRRRRQIDPSCRDGLLEISRKEGTRALFRGLSINYLKIVPAMSIAFGINDFLKHKLV